MSKSRELKGNLVVRSPRSKAACQVIADDLRAQIATGSLSPGDRLPSLRYLASTYNVTLGTVQQAVGFLVSDGALVTAANRGTFVASRTAPAADASAAFAAQQQFIASDRLALNVMVGVVTPVMIGQPDNPLARHGAHEIVASFERYIAEFDGVTRIFGHNDEAEHVVEIIDSAKMAVDAGCNALLAAMYFSARTAPPLIDLAMKAQIPIIFVGGEPVPEPAISVYYDHAGAGYQAANHLIAAGIDKIAFIGPYVDWWVRDHATGACSAVRNAQGVEIVAFPPEVLADRPEGDIHDPADWDHQQIVYNAAKALLADGLPAKGIIAANDRSAFGFMKAAAEFGWAAGRDYAIVGFDDHPLAKYRSLSTMQPPWNLMGREAGHLLVGALSGVRGNPSRVCLPSTLIARMSSRLMTSTLAAELV